MNVSEFATLVGTTAKTIYARIANNSELPVKEQLMTVKEKVKGRETTLILTDYEQIQIYKEIYSKINVNNNKYYETLTENNINQPVNVVTEQLEGVKIANSNELFERLLTLNDDYNNRIEQKNTELMNLYEELSTIKSKQLLLEDKASREGLYINEINELKKVNNGLQKDNNRNKIVIYSLITVIMIILTVFVTILIVNKNFSNSNDTKTPIESVEQISNQHK